MVIYELDDLFVFTSEVWEIVVELSCWDIGVCLFFFVVIFCTKLVKGLFF